MRKFLFFIAFLVASTIANGQLINGSLEEVANSYTTSYQQNPSIASDSLGNVVIVWETLNEDGSGYGIKAKFIGPSGAVLVADFMVNTTTANDQRFPKVALSENGKVFITWMGIGLSGDWDIYGKAYDLAGATLYAETVLNSTSSGMQRFPSVVGSADGSFVIVWENDSRINGKSFNANTNSLSGQFVVATSGIRQINPDVAFSSNTNFVITWQELDSQKDFEIKAQLFDYATLNNISSLVNISADASVHQVSPTVDTDESGKIYMAWTDAQNDGNGNGIFLGVYSGQLDSLMSFQVNVTNVGSQNNPAISTSKNGITAVTWNSYGTDGSFDGVFARVLDNKYNFQSIDIALNTFTSGFQSFAGLSLIQDEGPLVTAWQSGMRDSTNTQDGDQYGVVYRKYDLADIIDPVAVCQNIALVLGSDSTVSLSPGEIDNGSSDANGVTLTLSKSLFAIADTLVNNVYLIATDPSGNTDSCMAEVTVSFIKPKILSYNGIKADFCEKETFPFRINAQGYFAANNILSVQLSDKEGSFLSPAVLGTSTDTSYFNLTIPDTMLTGTQYKIRVLSSNYGTVGPESIPFTIYKTDTTITVSSCDTYTAPDANIYTSSGIYQATLMNQINCDSVITIDLTIRQSTDTLLTLVECDSYQAPDETVFNTPGTFQHQAVIPNALGCDSTITINLTLNAASQSTIDTTVCETYTAPDAQAYTSSGVYQAVIQNGVGCDSTVTINLTVGIPVTATIGGNYLIQQDEGVSFPIAFSGTPPFAVSFGATVVNNILTSPHTINFTPSGTMTYTISSVSNEICGLGTSSGTVNVTVGNSPCLSDVEIVSGSHAGLYRSSTYISSEGSVNGTSTYKAGNSISLENGFIVETGEVFQAIIEDCTD